MNLFSRRISAVASALFLSLLASTLPRTSYAATTVTLNPGDDIQAQVKANEPGTVFLLTAGVYRGQSVLAKTDDVFTGQGTVTFVGSTALTFEPAGGLWVAPATSINAQHGTCQKAYPLCLYPQDLYVDGKLQTIAVSRSNLAQGSWNIDRVAGKVYIPFDPTGHDVEIGMLPYAFSGAGTGVHINNITVEQYANLAQFGAIGGTITGAGWIVDHVEVRFNHGTGVKLGPGSQLLNSFIHHNGELGFNLNGDSSQAIGNEISFNNIAGYALGWEAGGAKFSGTTNLLIRSNNVHDNFGPGLWTDTDNVSTTYENNTITNNESAGIQHERSFSAVIRNNIITDNGWTGAGWLWNGQISIQNSSNAQVYGNTISVPGSGANGIAIINQNRGSGKMGPYIAANNSVYDNTITYESSTGATGIVNDTGSHPLMGNSFSSNHYLLKAGTTLDKHWCFFGIMKWNAWNASGQDDGGAMAMVTPK